MVGGDVCDDMCTSGGHECHHGYHHLLQTTVGGAVAHQYRGSDTHILTASQSGQALPSSLSRSALLLITASYL